MMFKIMVLQALYGLSDDQAEFQVQDRLSFMRFLGLGLGDRVPDAKTIWLFREHLTQAKAVENLFARFDKHLTRAGYLAMGGQIVDATIVAAPKQRNTDAEKADIKAGRVPDAWKEKPAKLRQKDRDARWTVKFSKAKVAEDAKTKQRDIEHLCRLLAENLAKVELEAPVLDLELGLVVRQAVERLQDHNLEHHHRVVGRPAASGAIRALQRLGQRLAENLPWHQRLQLLQRIAGFAQPHIALVDVPEPGLSPHSQPPANHRRSES